MDYVILAAGKGKRLWPITSSTQKCMLRILEKPILEWMVQEIAYDADSIIIITGHNSEEIMEYFSTTKYSEKIEFIEQKEQKGTAHALLQAESKVKGKEICVLNGDVFFAPEFYKNMRELISKNKFFVAGKETQANGKGILHSEDGKLKRIGEKELTEGNALVNAGAYFLPTEVFQEIRSLKLSARGEYELTDAVNALVSKFEINVIECNGFWSDIGYFWNYLDASAFALKECMRPEVRGTVEEGVHITGEVYVGEGAVVKSGSYIQGPCFIGKNANIGPNAYIREYSCVESECHVGSSELKNCVMLSGSNAPHGNYVGDSVVCEEANLGGGCMLTNLRFDDQNINVQIDGKKINSERRKLGTAIGRGAKLGANSTVNCGVLIGKNAKIFPNCFVSKNVQDEEVYRC